MPRKRRPPAKHICVLSDATGKTAERVVRATLSQFPDVRVSLDVVGKVETVEQVRDAIEKARRRGGLVAFTVVEPTLRSEVVSLANEAGVDTVDLLGPLLTVLSEFLAARPLRRPGLFAEPGEEMYRHLEAVSFTVRHDDGLALSEVDLAQVVLVGPSRTSKTPLSVYIAHTRGLRVANVPIALGIDPSPHLKDLPPFRVVGLTIRADVLSRIRRQRLEEMGKPDIQYAQLPHVEEELRFCHRFYLQAPSWPVVDVTSKSIEEVAMEVCAHTIDAGDAPG